MEAITLNSVVAMKREQNEWFSTIREKFIGDKFGVVTCISRHNKWIQVEFVGRTVNFLRSDQLILVLGAEA